MLVHTNHTQRRKKLLTLSKKNSIAKGKNLEPVKYSGVDDQSDEFYKKFLKEIGGAHSVYIPKNLAKDGISSSKFSCKKINLNINNIGFVRD